MNAPARTKPRGLAALPIDQLVKFAWEMSDLIDADAMAHPRRTSDPEPSWVTYARALEKQAFAVIVERTAREGAR